jgi:hypothetical protein
VHPGLANIYSIFFEISKNQKKHISIRYSHKNVLDINKDALRKLLKEPILSYIYYLLATNDSNVNLIHSQYKNLDF